MKIGIISSSYPPSLWNSIGRTTYSISQGLSALGHSVQVISYNPALGDKFAKDKEVRIQYLGIDGSSTLPIDKISLWQVKVTDYLRKYCKGLDLLICIDSYGFKAITDSNIQKKTIGICNFLYNATGWTQSIGKELETRFLHEELEFIKNTSVLLCNNEVTRVCAERKRDSSVGTYRLGIPEIKNYTYSPKSKQVLYVGKLNKEKGVERILRVMPKLKWMKLVLCDQNSGNAYRLIIQKLATELGILDRISFTEFLSTQNVWKLYTESEMCVVPHIAEPFGYSAIYPMSLGTPTIVSTANGLPEIVGNSGECGAIFSNIIELEYLLDETHQMPPMRDMFSEDGKQRIIEEYSIDKMISSITAHF